MQTFHSFPVLFLYSWVIFEVGWDRWREYHPLSMAGKRIALSLQDYETYVLLTALTNPSWTCRELNSGIRLKRPKFYHWTTSPKHFGHSWNWTNHFSIHNRTNCHYSIQPFVASVKNWTQIFRLTAECSAVELQRPSQWTTRLELARILSTCLANRRVYQFRHVHW